jgi:hypothetical protein
LRGRGGAAGERDGSKYLELAKRDVHSDLTAQLRDWID